MLTEGMLITELEVTGLLQSAVRRTASRMGVQDVEFQCIEELLDEIHERDAETHGLLVSFVHAYLDWLHFHKRIEEQGKSGNLDGEEQQELARLVDNREKTRRAIVERLRRTD